MSDLIERLRIVAAIERLPERGLASEAADHIEALEAKLAVAREALGNIKAHAIKLRHGTDDWFEMVEFEAWAGEALKEIEQ